MLTVLEIIKKTTEFFQGKGIESPRLDAELLVAHGLRLPRMQLYVQFERVLSETELNAIRPLVKRRGQREPLQHILGETEFFDLKLKTDRRALVPRPETEELVDWLARTLLPPPARVLDLGTGSGAIALGLARAWPQAAVTAIDKSPAALSLARDNAAASGLGVRVEFIESDWFAALYPARRFELIVANPPYLTATEVAEAQPEVREFDPPGALVSDDDGCADLEKILRGAPAFLEPGGWVALETGIAQHARLVELAKTLGYTQTESRQDLSGRDRFLVLQR